jgi:hypothetical protein
MRFPIFLITALSLLPNALLAQEYCSGTQATYSNGRPRPVARISRFTNYTPSSSYSSMQGKCGRSASGINACAFRFEDHVKGNVPAVMTAVAQRGGSSNLFGGIYRLDPIENTAGVGCVIALVGDRYASSSNGKDKMDVITEQNSSYARAINSARGNVRPVGTMREFRNTKRELIRDRCAVGTVGRSDACPRRRG